MKELDILINNFINDERLKLINQLCHNEINLICKKKLLINKYIKENNNTDMDMDICHEPNENYEMNISNENNEMNISNENNEINISNENKKENIDENQEMNISNEYVSEINNLSNQFETLSLKELQNICFQNGVDIHKFSQRSGNKINKTKKELLQLINSNTC